MQDNTPRYIVSFSNGKVAKLTEQEYNDSKDQIYQFDRNASAARINDFSFDDDVDDSATYTVGLPNGKFSVFSAQQYRDSREELRKVEGIQIGSLSPVDYWGDKLNALNKQIAELEPKHERAVAELSNPANSWDITDEDLDAGQAIEAARRSAEARDYERDIKKRLTALKEEREANPAYQSARQQRIQGLQDFTSGIESQQRALNEANPESHRIFMAPERNGMGVSDKAFDMRDNPGYYRDMEALGAAKMWIADAVKAEKAPSRYDTTRSGFQNFLTGVTSNVKELSTVLGLAEGIIKNAPLISTIKQIQGQEGDNANIIALVEKMQSDPNALPYLSDAQKTLVRAFVVKTLTDAELSGDTSLGYQAGQSAIASLGFMKDFILTGGEGSIAEAAAKGATKWMTKGIAKASLDLGLKGAGRATAQAIPKFAVGTVKGAVKTAIMTPFMPSSYKNLLDNLTRVNLQDGTVDLSGKAVLQAVGDVFIENFSENAGGQVEAILGVPFKALGTAADKVFANTAFSTWGKAVGNAQITKLLKQAGWNGFIGEIGEEWYGNALRVMTGVDKDALKDFATVDQQIITLASFAPMSIFGLGASSGQYLAARKQMEGAGEKLSQILAKNNYSEDQIQAILAATKAENPTELAQLLSPVVNQIAADNGDASEAYKAVCDFAKAIAQYRTLDGLRDSDAEGERRQAAAAIDVELGAATPTFGEEGEINGESPWMQQKSVDTPSGPVAVNSVRVLTDANGTEYFVKSESETDGYGLVERGTGRPVAAPTLDGYTDSGVMSLNDFLDREIARKRRGADQVRMAQETLQNRAQIIHQAQLGTQLNLGTEENPVMGTIREIQPGDVFIIESERGTRPYSLQEVADFMRHPLNSLPAEEIDNQTAEMMNRISEKKNTLNQMLIDGNAGPVKYQEQTVIRVIGQDGNGNARILTAEGEDGIDITEDELDALLAQAQQKPVADIQQEEQDNQQPEDVEDTVLRDFRGNPLPLKTNKKGETVVNWVKLWKDDPEAWARWNDAQERPIVDTKLKLSEGIKDLQKEQEKLQKELSKEILHGMDEDKMDDYQDRLATVANRLDVLTKVLNTYNLPAQAADTFAGEQRRAAAEQTIREQQAGFPGIQKKWNDAPKIVGAADEIRLPNGENITGHYVLTEAYAPTPSHNPADGFKMTDGFPVDENGKTVNDRDYEHDADAQKQVLEKAANYDQRALQTPVIVSADGVVLSGNDRTMASQLAAQSGTDGAYVEYLTKYSQKYGFTAEQVQGLAHPRVVFVPDSEMEYNAATFAKFNADDKKSQSKTEKAVKAGKTLSSEALGSLATLVDRYEDINALYNDAAGVQELLDTLQAAEVITPEQIAALKDGDKLSGTGMDLLESTLIGSAMDEEAVRIAMSDPSIRKPIVSAIAQIIANNTIEGYTLRTELTDAIILVAQGKGAGEIKTGESVQSFIRQQHLFMDDVVASATVQMLADAINDRRTTQLKKVLSLYNRDAVDAASGQMSLLTQDVPSRDYILRNILEYLGYDTSIIFDTSERESEQRAAAEAAAADQGGNESQESEAGAPVQSDTGSAVTQFDREEVAAILEQGNVGETGLAEYMSDDEVAEFMRLWDEFLPYNDALGEAYNRLGDDLRATADKAKRKAAQAEIDRLEQAQAEAFVPVQDYVDSLLAKYDLFEEPYERNRDEAEPQDVENEIDAEEPEAEVEEDIDTPEEPKPDKSKKGGKKSRKGKKASNSGTVFSGDISDEALAAVEYTTDEVEQLIFGASLFGDYTSKKTGEKIEIVYADDEHPVYFDHQIRFWIWQKGAEYGDRHEATATTDYMMRYLKANGFKLTKPSAKKNKYGYWSSFKGASGFLFGNEADAIKFNTIESTDNGEITNKQTASTTAVIVSEAASAASKAEALAESTEPADEKRANKAIARIDNALDAIDDQLALLGYYEADTSDESSFNEMYGYMKSAEKKAVKDADRLAKRLAKDLGIEVGRKTLAKANLAPAGGDITFSLQLPLPKQGTSDYQELFVDIHMEPDEGNSDNLLIGDGWGKNLAIMFRIEDTGQMGVARFGQNHFAPYNVSYDELLKAIRYQAKDFLREQPTEYTGGPVDLVQVAQEQAEKNRKAGNSKKKSVSSREDGDAALGGLFADLYEAEEDVDEEPEMPVGLGRKREKPTEVNGFKVGDKVIYTPDQGKRQPVQATIHDFEQDGRPVLDTGLAPVLYEVVDWNQISKIENEPVNDTNDGLQRTDEQRTGGPATDGSGQQQGLQRGTGEEGEVPGQESERADRGGEGGREGDVHGRARTLRPRYDDSVKRNTRNYRRAKGDDVPKTVAARYKANIAAIRLLKELQDSGKQATKEQMAVLRQYTGWGGLGGYFNNEYSPEYREMRSLLTDEEMQAAALSINTAYYTPTEIIESMWDIAKRLGFEGGNVLEGSAGIGNILASMPKNISERSAITAVELDNITGGILQLLYPDANVQIKGFQEVDIPNGSVDLAITNVPFGDINVYDSKEKDLTRKFGGKIHDFCIAKNIRKLAEGGIGIFISTRGTLDGSSKALRQWIVNEGNADVIGAFRLNNATFEGTKATSDIIVVRKRVNGQVSPNAINVTDTEITRRVDYQTGDTEWNKNTRSWEPVTGKAAMEMNAYFVEHPENMGGEMGFGFEHKDTFRPGSAALWPSEKIDQNKRLAKWAKQFSSMQEEAAPTASETESAEQEATQTKEGQLITNSKGEICISRSGKAVPLGVNAQKVKGYTKAQVLADYDALKTAINDVLNYQLNNESDEGLKPLIDKLNKAYDRFAKRYDRLNRNTAISFLRNDVDFPSIAAVEDYREKKGIDGKVKIEVKKTSIFSGRVLGAKRIPTPANAKDGVIVSINQFGRIDIPFIADALKKDEDTVRKEILASGLGFENPLTGNVEVEYEYLSGNVREKLEYARAHNTDGQYDKNIEALEKVIPADIPAHLIEFSLGSDWMPVELYTEYAKEKFGVNDNFVPTMVGGSWLIPENTWELGVNTEQNRAAGVHSEKLRMDKKGHELLIAAMNNTSVVFSRTYKDPSTGESVTEHDKEATQAATTKMSEMRDDFKEWCKAKMLDTPELAERISKLYNDTFNAIVPKEIRDTFIPEHFDGMATKLNNGKPLNLRQHQAKAVIRATTEPLMMAHEVGTGKTFTLIATAMEMRRLGTAKKPMIVVQNSTLGQFVSSAKELYPNAKILTISEADRTVEGRSAFYAKIKYNDWDMIVVPQSVFEMIPDSEERQRAFIQEKIDEKKFILEQVKQAKNSTAERQLKKELEDLEYEYQYGEKPPKKGKGGKKDAKKEAEAVENAVAKAKKQLDRRTDEVADFDEMGIDALLVDEAHSYKHLGFSTAMQRGVKGVDATGSKKSAGVYLKTRSVFDKVGWKNVVFATGTPISNTAAEIWTFMKYLMPADVMRQNHIYYFDDFVRNFGNIAQSLEFTTSGKFKETTRFASYTNLPELIRIWSSVTDTVRSKDAVAEGDEKLEDKQPKMEGGQARDIYLPQSLSLVDIMTAVRAKLEWYEGLSGKEKKENSHIPLTMFGIAKMAAIDPRLVDRDAQDEPESKTNKAVEETLQALKDSEKYKGTAALFCDNFRRWDYNDAGKRVEGFNIFEEIKRKLVAAGIPEGQIVIMKSGMNTAAKEKIFARVNSGEVRVIMGTTATLGTGVNIQERLFFEAHLDAPNRPMDYTQRNGRILRQGNLHKEWGIPVRVVRFGVEDSLDVTAYQRLSTKAKFIDSIMDGKPLLANGMENRVLEEEEEGEFDNPVAVLSGSQYALLKSQAERELRKLRNKKEQHRQDQIYIERTLKENKSRIAYDEKLIEEAKANLAKVKTAFPDGTVKEISIEGRKAKGAEQIAEAIKDKITVPLRSRLDSRRVERGFTNETLNYTMTFDGVPVNIKVDVERMNEYDEKRHEYRPIMRTRVEYSVPRFGIDGRFVQGGYTSIKDIVPDFITRIASGRYFEDAVNNLTNTVNRLNSDNGLMMQRRGKPFADEDKLAQQEEIVKDYTEKMRAELAEKEAKYAEMAKNAKTSFNLDSVEIEDEDEEEGETHNSDIVEGAPKLNISDPLVLADAVRAVNRLAKRLGLRVVFDDELESKGAYTEGTDYVRINLANCESVDDAIETLLHEGVAHFGLREMLGEEGMKEFISDILSKAAPSIRAKIDALAAENGWSLEYAAEEYVAELAQKTDYTKAERSLWREILNAVRNLIASITGRDTYITDDVIREMLVASYANLEERSANSAENKLSALNAAVQNMSRFDTDYIPTQKKRREIIENYIEGIRGGDKDVAVVTNEEFLDKAAEWGLSEEETNTLNKVIRLVRVAGKTFEDGRIIIFTDNIEDLEQARQVYVHERQHFLTNGYGADFIERVIRAFDGIGGPEYTRLYLKDAVRRIGRTDAYDKYSEIGLAQEFVSFAMQLAYTEENFADAMKKLYIRPAAIDIIKELDNEQRKESSLSAARRRPADNASDGRRGEDADANRRRASGNGYNGASAEDGGNEGQGVTHYRVRSKPAPEKTGIGYKVFFRGRDGRLYPPMVANPGGEATPVGVWLDADAAPVAGQSKTGRPQVKAGGKGTQGGSGTLAYRPGWHLGEIPYAIQFNRINPETGQRELFPKDFVWAEVEYAADKDYQKDADAEGMTEGGKYRHSYAGLKEVPEDGFYRYRTNPNPETDPWIITGAMKVNRILADEEVDELVRAAGREPQKREPSVSRNRVAFHGSIADFDAFDIDHAGEGEGFQSHGYGHYVALNKDTAIGYAWSNAFDKADKEGLISPTIAEIIRNDSFDDYDSMVERYDELHAKRIEELKQEIADERKERTPDMNTIGLLETELGLLEKDRPLREVFEGMRNLYTVEIPEDTGTNYLDEKGETPKSVVSRIYAALNQLAKDKKNKELAERVQIKKPTIEQIYGDNGQIRTGGALYDGLSLILGSPLEASRFLHGIGIVGIKYDGRSDGQCAVIFSNEDLRIEEHERWRQGGDYGNPSPVRYKESIGARRLSASETATKFGVGIEFRPSSEMRQDGKPLAGRWVDGKIYICLEHCRDNDDAVRTVLHEGVGHQGLRRLIGGDNMREFCLDIFRNAPVAVRSKIAKDAVEKYGGNVVEAVERMAADDVIREVGGEAVFESAEEWMAETSETIDYDNYRRNLWDIIRSALRKALAKVGINIPLSVRDVKWIMVQSAFANHETDALAEARRQVVAKELGFTLRQQADKAEGIRLERNRRADESLSSAARLYNKDVLYWWSRLHETWVDKDDAVHRLVSAIEKASGKVAETFEDIRLSLNQQSSKGLAAIEKFEREYYEPMKAAIKYIMGEKGCSLEDVERYVMLKHGLERNEVFAKRDARAYYQDLHDGNVRSIQNSDKIDDITKLQLIAREDKKLQKNLDAIEAGTDSKYLEFRKQDYGGLTAMYSEYDDFAPFDESLESNEEYQARVLQARHPKYTYIDENGREKVDMAATEDAARKEVEAFENGSEDSTKNLWERINAATKATLKHQYDSNMMSREQYLSVSKMFKYYVPLRGFADNAAEDMYDYYHSDQRNTFTPPLLVAKGRKTEAESPFGYIGAMASSGIAADMKNETKLALYYFVSNRSDNDLVSISEVWYKVTGVDELGRKIFTPVYPPFKEDLSSEEAKQAFRDWEEQMKEEAKAGLAYKGMRKLDLHKSVIHIDENQKTSHIIRFKVGGKDMMMYINGNPRAAQAINNELNVDAAKDEPTKVLLKTLRFMSGLNTQYNPEFWLSNMQRDVLFALMSISVKEDKEYNEAFRKNLLKARKVVAMMKAMNSNSLGDTPIENLYREFVENGGVTGYTTLKDNEEWEMELRKYLTGKEKPIKLGWNKFKNVVEKISDFGEAIEQMTRFAAYMTSREQGRDIKDSVNDAKELTVNFNRKGSGKGITFAEAKKLRDGKGRPLSPVGRLLVVALSSIAPYGRRAIMFFNASVQGLNSMIKLYRVNPKKMSGWTIGYIALGVINAVIHSLLDDDDDYLDIPDWERRNNLLLGFAGGYFKWALPQEARVFYGLGDMIVNHAMGREPHKGIVGEVLSMVGEAAPIDFPSGVGAFIPSVLAPAWEIYENKDYKGSRVYNEQHFMSDEQKKFTPRYINALPNTGRVYIAIAKAMNRLTGGDDYEAGGINIDPNIVEHLIEGYSGGAGTAMEKLFQFFGDTVHGEFNTRNTPFLRRVFTLNDERYRNAHTNDLFYYYKGKAENTKTMLNKARKNGDDDKLDRLYDSEDYEIMLIYNTYKGELQYYNDELKITEDKKERKALMREQDAIRKQMILEISNIGKND